MESNPNILFRFYFCSLILIFIKDTSCNDAPESGNQWSLKLNSNSINQNNGNLNKLIYKREDAGNEIQQPHHSSNLEFDKYYNENENYNENNYDLKFEKKINSHNGSSKSESSAFQILPVVNRPLQVTLLALILLIAILSNLSIIYNISTDSLKLRMVHFLLIRHVCITDFVGSLLVLPIPLVAVIKGTWDFGSTPEFCTITSTVTATCWTMHLLAVALYRADRVLAVWLPTGHYPIISTKITHFLLLLIWLLAIGGCYLATTLFGPVFQPALALCIPDVPLIFFVIVFASYCIGLIGLTTGYVLAFARRRRRNIRRKRRERGKELYPKLCSHTPFEPVPNALIELDLDEDLEDFDYDSHSNKKSKHQTRLRAHSAQLSSRPNIDLINGHTSASTQPPRRTWSASSGVCRRLPVLHTIQQYREPVVVKSSNSSPVNKQPFVPEITAQEPPESPTATTSNNGYTRLESNESLVSSSISATNELLSKLTHSLSLDEGGKVNNLFKRSLNFATSNSKSFDCTTDNLLSKNLRAHFNNVLNQGSGNASQVNSCQQGLPILNDEDAMVEEISNGEDLESESESDDDYTLSYNSSNNGELKTSESTDQKQYFGGYVGPLDDESSAACGEIVEQEQTLEEIKCGEQLQQNLESKCCAQDVSHCVESAKDDSKRLLKSKNYEINSRFNYTSYEIAVGSSAGDMIPQCSGESQYCPEDLDSSDDGASVQHRVSKPEAQIRYADSDFCENDENVLDTNEIQDINAIRSAAIIPSSTHKNYTTYPVMRTKKDKQSYSQATAGCNNTAADSSGSAANTYWSLDRRLPNDNPAFVLNNENKSNNLVHSLHPNAAANKYMTATETTSGSHSPSINSLSLCGDGRPQQNDDGTSMNSKSKPQNRLRRPRPPRVKHFRNKSSKSGPATRALASYVVSVGHLLLYLPAMFVVGLQGSKLPPGVALFCGIVVYCDFLIQPIALLLVSRRLRIEVFRSIKGLFGVKRGVKGQQEFGPKQQQKAVEGRQEIVPPAVGNHLNTR